jgi:hypothetical protein
MMEHIGASSIAAPVCFAISLGSVWRDGQVTNTLFLNTHSIWNVDGGYEHVQHVHYRDNMYVFEGPSPEYGPQKYNQTSIELRGDFNQKHTLDIVRHSLDCCCCCIAAILSFSWKRAKEKKTASTCLPSCSTWLHSSIGFRHQMIPLVLGTKSGSND